MNEVSRDEFVKAVQCRGYDHNEVHTVNRSVMEHYDENGELFASAEYVKVLGEACMVTYRCKPMM